MLKYKNTSKFKKFVRGDSVRVTNTQSLNFNAQGTVYYIEENLQEPHNTKYYINGKNPQILSKFLQANPECDQEDYSSVVHIGIFYDNDMIKLFDGINYSA